uniref:SWIM-type domain-containing protein n=2 Tax=Chenopodium quinoa TaxID=63459 RepID=A0A803KXH2_CHEQI
MPETSKASNYENLMREFLQLQRDNRPPLTQHPEKTWSFDLNQTFREGEAENFVDDLDEFNDDNIQNSKVPEIQIQEDEDQVIPNTLDEEGQPVDEDEDTNPKPIDTTGLDMEGSLVGVERDTYQEIYDLYSLHASTVGFSIRKHTTRYRLHTRIVTEKYYVCYAEGKRHIAAKKTNMVLMVDEDNKDLKQRKPRQVSITRTNCKESLRAKMNDDGKFNVVSHVLQHNHELTRKQWHYLHRSKSEVKIEKAVAIKTMKSAGLSTMDTYNYMCTEANGDENLGHSVVDHLNFCSRLRMEQIEAGDAQTLVNILIEEQKEDPNFYFRVKFDKEGNEKTDSFVWLLETFKKSMENRIPTSIFTDQDQAMATAIEQVLPDTRHRLCIWHLEQNAITRFGALKRDNEFKKIFNKCLKGCVTETEFEERWKEMIQKFDLVNHAWYQRVYNLKEKWCPAFSKDFFSAGILSSQRSESTNHAVGFRANKSTTLTEFYRIFVRTIKRWRSDEKYNEFTCSKSIAFTSLPLSGMLKHAAQVYTLSLFRDFEEEFGYSMATTVQILGRTEENIILYEVSLEEKPWSSQQVSYIHESQTIWCTCKNFEASGWLCYHCLRILHLHSITRIPEKYISKRWTKLAKTEVWNRMENKDPKLPYTPWRHTMMRKYYNLILKSQENEKARAFMEEKFKNCMKMVEDLLAAEAFTEEVAASDDNSNVAESSQSTNNTASSSTSTTIPTILDPKRVVTKGRSKRAKGALEKGKKSKQKALPDPNSEFGSKTPTVRLF